MKFLTRKVGPLPAWGWGLIGVALVLAYVWWQKSKGGGANTGTLSGAQSPDQFGFPPTGSLSGGPTGVAGPPIGSGGGVSVSGTGSPGSPQPTVRTQPASTIQPAQAAPRAPAPAAPRTVSYKPTAPYTNVSSEVNRYPTMFQPAGVALTPSFSSSVISAYYPGGHTTPVLSTVRQAPPRTGVVRS